MLKFHLTNLAMFELNGTLRTLKTVKAMMANTPFSNAAMFKSPGFSMKPATLPTTPLPEAFSIPGAPSLDFPDISPEKGTHDEPSNKSRRIGFNREDML